jgi:hypothetical protein
MFVYYFIHVERPFEEVEPALLRMIPGLGGWAEDAYRDGEHLRTRVGTRGGMLAKAVEVTTGSPVRGASETWIPIRWEATGAPSLFPSLEADVITAHVGASLTQVALRGTYQAPFGRVGDALDRVLLHRIAEVSVKTFVDRIAESIQSDLLVHENERGV